MQKSTKVLRLLLAALIFSVFTSPLTAVGKPVLMLFGGTNHTVFLGCLSCSQYDSKSIWNAYGQYGSIYSSSSIWNEYGTFGSQYSFTSPWNSYSTSPPIIVDSNGNFYGYFTTNKYQPQRTKITWVLWILDNHEYVLKHLDEVRNIF